MAGSFDTACMSACRLMPRPASPSYGAPSFAPQFGEGGYGSPAQKSVRGRGASRHAGPRAEPRVQGPARSAPVRALVFGVTAAAVDRPRRTAARAEPGHHARGAAGVPDARPLRPDWLVTRPLLTGICGSDSKQILLDFGRATATARMSGLCSFPQVMGHEVVAEVAELGPEADGLRRRASAWS